MALSKEEILQKIDLHRRMKKSAEDDIRKYLPVLRKYRDFDEIDLTVNELQELVDAKPKVYNAEYTIGKAQEELACLEEKLKEVEAAAARRLPKLTLEEGLRELRHLDRPVGGVNHSVDLCSSVTNVSSREKKLLEIKVRQQHKALEAVRDADLEKLEFEKETLQFDLKAPQLEPARRQHLETELARLEMKKRQVLRSYSREKRTIDEQRSLALARIEAENEDEQFLDPEEEEQVRKFNYERDNAGQQEVSPATTQRHPEDDKQSIVSGYLTGGSVSSAPAVNKDALLLQLMQTQMDFLQKSQVSPGDKYLPDFDGDPAKWGNFKAAYERLLRKHKPDDSELMMKLQKVLKGNARATVEHLMANVSNVTNIIDTLEFRFGRPEYVLDFLIEKVKSCAKPDQSKPESIVEFGTNVDALLANITAFGEDDYLHSRQLVNELTKKLPGAMKDEWHMWLEERSERKKNLQSFADWLRKRVRVAMHRIEPPTAATWNSSSDGSKTRSRRGPGMANAASGDSDTEERPKTCKSSEMCTVCKKRRHSLDQCWVFQKMTNDEKWNIVRERKVCFCCLKSGHQTSACPDKKVCGIGGCTRNHHNLLHHSQPMRAGRNAAPAPQAAAPANRPEVQPSAPPEADIVNGNFGAAIYIEGTDGPLAIVPVRIRPKASTEIVTTYALLDSGATRTMITENVVEKLGLSGPPVRYRYKVVGGEMKVNNNSMKVNFDISGRFRNAKFYPVENAIMVTGIGLLPYSINVEEVKKKWPHMRKMQGENLCRVVPEIIIGGDHGFLMLHHEILYKSIREPVAARTLLGWVCQGKFQYGEMTTGARVSYYVGGVDDMDNTLHNMIKESFKIEEIDSVSAEPAMSLNDRKALAIMESTSVKKEGRWTIGHLWKDDGAMDAGVNEALTRLWQTERKMKRDPEFAKVYKGKIQEYLSKGFLRKLTSEEAAEIKPRTKYIPHFGVTNPNKPGKFRLVLDCAAKSGEKSLNDMLYTGPDLIRPLVSVLMNFRRHPVVLCGDIEDMFHRIFIREEDRCAQRIFWRDGDSSTKPDTYEMNVMIFGATSSPSCAIFIKNKNAKEFETRMPAAVNAIVQDCYIDDLLSGSDTPSQVIKLREEITRINTAGGFNMKKFISNSPEVMASIPPELRLEAAKNFTEKSLYESERVLGLWWSPFEDDFTFKLNFHKVDPDVVKGRRPTKREVCSLLMSLYDPLGFINNYKIKGMIIMQQVWRTGIGWDDFVTDEVYSDWGRWLAEMNQLPNIKIPRCYSLELRAAQRIQLHTLVDASSEAYCAVSYLRVETLDHVEVSFVASRVKVAPLKKSTIPRLELQAAVLGAKLASYIMKELAVKVDRCFFWSDSSTALSWIKSESARFKDFVANRVGFIQESTNAEDWRWIPTADNVADDATRCDCQTDLTSESRWLRGPSFLKLKPAQWPKKKEQKDEEGIIAAATSPEITGKLPPPSCQESELSLPKVDRFSNYSRLLRATAAVGAAVRFWINRRPRKSKNFENKPVEQPWRKVGSELISNLTTENLEEAETRLIKVAQSEYAKDRNSKKNHPKLMNLKVGWDSEGILRVRGRISRADATEKMKNPAVLPGDHHVSNLIVDAEHVKNAHTGEETVFNNLRQIIWITTGRTAVKKAFARCLVCKIAKAKPVIPEMGDLPSYRLAANQPVFTFTGVDFFGPFEITVGRRHEKRWVALFTCIVTRATYVDIAAGLSKEDMMHVFSRFVDEHRVPRHVYSDNGTNFVAVSKEIEAKMTGVKWSFIPPGSPHFGGAWERMVQAVKKVLRNLLKEKYPREEVLRTLLKAAQNIVNSRPLTHVSSDPDDPESLTPNHFLRGAAVCTGSADLGNGVGPDAEHLRNQFAKSQWYINQFWKRWSHEVLPDLVKKTKWLNDKEPLQIGDVVLLVDEQQPRGTWTKGIVTKTFPGDDGLVRVVEVSHRPFKGKVKTYRRSVAKICPIGIRVEDSVSFYSP